MILQAVRQRASCDSLTPGPWKSPHITGDAGTARRDARSAVDRALPAHYGSVLLPRGRADTRIPGNFRGKSCPPRRNAIPRSEAPRVYLGCEQHLPVSISGRDRAKGDRARRRNASLAQLLACGQPYPGKPRRLRGIQMRIVQPGVHLDSSRQDDRREPIGKLPPVGERLQAAGVEASRSLRSANEAYRAGRDANLLDEFPERGQILLGNGLRHRGGSKVERTGNAAELMRQRRQGVAGQLRSFGGRPFHHVVVSATGQDVPHSGGFCCPVT